MGSNFYNMRKLHLFIKGTLIRKYSNPGDKVFDVSVGRYGDMHNYYKAGIRHITGIDPDKNSIEEARKRSLVYPDLKSLLSVDTISNSSISVPLEQYDTIVCNFTMHYLFANKNMLHNSIKNISERLKVGGYFIGTTLNGKLLDNTLNDCEFVKYIPNEDSYQFYLLDGPESGNYFNGVDNNIEYRVCLNTLREVCEEYNLKLINYIPFGKYKWNRSNFNASERKVSSLYCSFVFCKIK